MAYVDDLLRRVSEDGLREALVAEVTRLRTAAEFGLVFERHLPESAVMLHERVRPGSTVAAEGTDGLWRATRIVDDIVRIHSLDGHKPRDAHIASLQVVRRFGDPVYPGLTSRGRLQEGNSDAPFHTVVNGENFHALEMLGYVVAGRVDLCYIDPPYNTGNRDWKYNNDYVDGNDRYRHSKWLSFMERRLSLARQLLDPDTGVLIVTVDENEHGRLSVLLQQMFRAYDHTSVSIVHNPRGIQGDNFSHTHETAIFVTPAKRKVLSARPLSPEEVIENTSPLRNWGGTSKRHDAANCFYPILVRKDEVVGFGDDVTNDESIHPAFNESFPDGTVAVWPIDSNGVERKWRYSRTSVESIRHLLVVRTNKQGKAKGQVDILLAKEEAKYKTVWQDSRYDSSTHGTALVNRMLSGTFDYPKSLYAVLECVRSVTTDKPDAVILDFFAGSGTTAHAVALLNSRDGGRRRAILVTNNEVSPETDARLRQAGHRPGSSYYEQHGIFHSVTKPRLTAAVTGARDDGLPVPGTYDDGSPIADGLRANIEFFDLAYLDRDTVALGTAFGAIAPVLWMKAGSLGPRVDTVSNSYSIPVGGSYGVLFNPSRRQGLDAEVRANPSIRVLFVVTDSEAIFQQVAMELPPYVQPVQLYEDYLRNFEINTQGLA